ncbi:phosphotransferase family protein [Polyplosphaeria fusca]|uniref:Phosphotransferase family protein n=1 Tax=Polyplosphaeria fusca TaxID=682080 RepID=A0A9P4QRX4_9PLEO|nr:phosphotransferase family protein [Polyplosphaeria fusca]
MTSCARFSPSDLPDGTKPRMYFLDSSYFRDHGANRTLPSPAEVLARSLINQRPSNPPPVKFEELNLIVKFGPTISTSEALCLWAIRKFLYGQVPVPEVYGWDSDGRHVFIYMQLIHGVTLFERYDSLSSDDKRAICQDLRRIMSQLRAIRQSPSNQVIGSITHGPLQDRILDSHPGTGPFPIVREFHDHLSWLWRRIALEPEKVTDPWRKSLPDDGPIVFTHSDLHRKNIIITSTTPARILSIVDWEQAGWYPDYWEYCKATYSVGDWEDWRCGGWIDSFLTPHPQSKEAWDFTCNSIGGF